MKFTIDETNQVQFDDGTTASLETHNYPFQTMATRTKHVYKVYKITRYKEQGRMQNACPTPRTREGEAELLMTLVR